MKKKMAVLMLAGMMAISAVGCGKDTEKPEDEGKAPVVSEQGASNEETETKETFSFADLKNVEFWFGSGAGGWSTVLTIKEDGSFFGEYADSEMGSFGEDYPNGTVYQCMFNGRFTEPVKVNDYTYSMRIAEISYENEVDTEESRDGLKYVYCEPYGLSDAENILIYLPGTPTGEIPEECLSWLAGSGSFSADEKELPFYALNNESQQEGFSSRNIVDDIQADLTYMEERSAELERVLENEPLTQAEYNEKAEELYVMWDELLNRIWIVLDQTKDAEFMEALTVEEREWIAEKEKAVEEAAAEVEDGSMEPMVRNLKAVELTKERVYELIELLEE